MNTANPGKFILIDRDDTILVDKGYMHRPEELQFLPGSIKALEVLQDNGYRLILVTNQSGIGREYFSQPQYERFMAVFTQHLREHGVLFERIFFCPHVPKDDCDCRKPLPGPAGRYLNEQHMNRQFSYVIGDRDSDIQFGINLGLSTILVEGGKDTPTLTPDFRVNSLKEAASLILGRESQ